MMVSFEIRFPSHLGIWNVFSPYDFTCLESLCAGGHSVLSFPSYHKVPSPTLGQRQGQPQALLTLGSRAQQHLMLILCLDQGMKEDTTNMSPHPLSTELPEYEEQHKLLL